jgi:DNA-binding SARP family transcriptional activator
MRAQASHTYYWGMETYLARCEPCPIVVEAASGTVLCDGLPVRLSPREREHAIAIAIQPRPAPLEALAELIYPDRDAGEAANAIKVYVYRLRRRVHPAFIAYRDGGYVLGPGVGVDVKLAHDALATITRDGWPPEGAERNELFRLARLLRVDRPVFFPEGTWYDGVALLVRRLGHDLTMLLARSAAEQGNLHEAIQVAREMTYEDICDEEAWELLIRTQLRAGEPGAARAGFRHYQAALAQELDALPSPHIRELLECGHRASAL